MDYVPAVKYPEIMTEKIYWLLFNKDEMLVEVRNDKANIPCNNNLSEVIQGISNKQYLGRFNNLDCIAAKLPESFNVPENMVIKSMRGLLGLLDSDEFGITGKAYQIVNWDINHKFCGRCSSEMQVKPGERVKICPSCGLANYPRISPAVIVSVIKDSKILLANVTRFKTTLYSVLAGFVDAGETFEDCVRREIKEEVDITVKNIKYFGSQPWPFPDSLMVAFTAEYESGEINPDGEEIHDAGWFSADNLPQIPGKWSIARKLIDSFIEKYSK